MSVTSRKEHRGVVEILRHTTDESNNGMGHMACMGEKRGVKRISREKQKERATGDLSVDGRIQAWEDSG